MTLILNKVEFVGQYIAGRQLLAKSRLVKFDAALTKSEEDVVKFVLIN